VMILGLDLIMTMTDADLLNLCPVESELGTLYQLELDPDGYWIAYDYKLSIGSADINHTS
jgi:hypothetical protein